MGRNPKKDEDHPVLIQKRIRELGRRTFDRADPCGMVRLFLKYFLQKENLDRKTRLIDWLSIVHRVKVSHLGQWAEMARKAILESATLEFQDLFRREPSEVERVFLMTHIDEFVTKVGKNRIENL